MARFADAVLFTPTAGGTTDFTVSAAVQGFMTPALSGMPTGTYKYRAESQDLLQWEMGEGTYTSGTGVLTRTSVYYNSAGTGLNSGQSGAGSKINFTVPPQVGVVQMTADTLAPDQALAWSATQKSQARQNISAPFVHVGDAPPGGPVANESLWFESDTGTLYFYYGDGSSNQWVAITTNTNLAAVLFTAQTLSTTQQQQAKSNINVGEPYAGSGFFSYVSATQVQFAPFNGRHIKINGVYYPIPAAGITASNGGLSASTVYWAYAWMNAGVMTIEFSATGFETDTSGTDNTGTVIKSGDASRTLIGVIRTNASSQFVDGTTQRFVRSYFNRRPVYCRTAGLGSNVALTGSLAEVTSALRTEFVCFGDELVKGDGNITFFGSTNGNVLTYGLYMDGASGAGSNSVINITTPGSVMPNSVHSIWAPAAGYHMCTIYGQITGGGTASLYSSAAYNLQIG